jgi:hypothetical protein
MQRRVLPKQSSQVLSPSKAIVASPSNTASVLMQRPVLPKQSTQVASPSKAIDATPSKTASSPFKAIVASHYRVSQVVPEQSLQVIIEQLLQVIIEQS